MIYDLVEIRGKRYKAEIKNKKDFVEFLLNIKEEKKPTLNDFVEWDKKSYEIIEVVINGHVCRIFGKLKGKNSKDGDN